jgi:nucleoid DNA-binding protein
MSEEKKLLGKSALYTELAVATGLDKKDVKALLDALPAVIQAQLDKKGPGTFVLPGLMKITSVHKPGRPAGKKPNPFKPGEMMDVKEKPPFNVLKIRALKMLKDMV